MRLPASQARAITRGAKKTVRVPVDRRLLARPLPPASRHAAKPFRVEPGDMLPMHGGRRYFEDGRWKWATEVTVFASVVTCEIEQLGHLTPEQAQAEGYSTVDEFEVEWVERHDRAWLDRQVQVLREAGAEDAEETRDEWARQRYEPRWAPALVWVIELTPIHDMPLLLADEHGTLHGDTGYVHSPSAAMPEEPEAVNAGVLDPKWRRHAEARRLKAKTLEERRREARVIARRVRQLALDGDPIVTAVERLIDRAEEAAEEERAA